MPDQDEPDDPEVTAEMIEAGAMLIYGRPSDAEHDPHTLARAVYLAMARLAPRSSSPCRSDTPEMLGAGIDQLTRLVALTPADDPEEIVTRVYAAMTGAARG